ncbi:MAG: SDR family oxidoreductase [Sphingomonadales bacterium]|nr:SDR family oxidoreductase [Sphingomonadales bacterium]
MADRFSLAGKWVLVTGSAGGIGAGIALSLAQAGALTVVSDINSEGARARANELTAAGHQADWIAIDVADETSVIAACAELIRRHGPPWALVNNAGVQDRQYIAEETVAAWDRIQAINARGPFLVTREFGRAMAAAGHGGRIVNIASGVLAGMIVKGAAAYTASKGALAALSSVTALEYAEHGITVNTILPGAVITPGTMNASGPGTEGPGIRRAPFGLCEPEDIGLAVLFLVSPAARMVTNQILAVDGGFSIS